MYAFCKYQVGLTQSLTSLVVICH